MQRMMLFCLLPVLAAAPIAAQSFEGTVTMKMNIGTVEAETKILIKGDKSVTLMTLGAWAGPMAGREARTITDMKAMTSTALVPMEMGGSKGVKTVIDLSKANLQQPGTSVQIKELGTSETIAGYKCDNVQVTSGTNVTLVCVSHELGHFGTPTGGMSGRSGGSAADWMGAFGSRPIFPLRATNAAGKVIMQVTSVQKGPVADSEFVIPDGYTDMGNMGGMMGGRGRGGGF
jgi:hypothetical protein